MRRAQSRWLIIFFCALSLIVAQESMFAHLIGHIERAASSPTAPDDYGGTASHRCAVCTAFAGLAAAPGAAIPTIALCPAAHLLCPHLPRVTAPTPFAGAYAARAPPGIL